MDALYGYVEDFVQPEWKIKIVGMVDNIAEVIDVIVRANEQVGVRRPNHSLR